MCNFDSHRPHRSKLLHSLNLRTRGPYFLLRIGEAHGCQFSILSARIWMSRLGTPRVGDVNWSQKNQTFRPFERPEGAATQKGKNAQRMGHLPWLPDGGRVFSFCGKLARIGCILRFMPDPYASHVHDGKITKLTDCFQQQTSCTVYHELLTKFRCRRFYFENEKKDSWKFILDVYQGDLKEQDVPEIIAGLGAGKWRSVLEEYSGKRIPLFKDKKFTTSAEFRAWPKIFKHLD